jgi:hypothetical protein
MRERRLGRYVRRKGDITLEISNAPVPPLERNFLALKCNTKVLFQEAG